jgi:hypothetical protein
VLSKARYPRICANCSGSHLVLPSDEDKWLYAPGSPIRTLPGPLSILSLRTCHDFSMCASQQTSLLMQYLFFEVRWQAGFPVQCESGQNPHVSHPQLQCSQSVFPVQCNLCVLNPIRRSHHPMQSKSRNSIKWPFGSFLDCWTVAGTKIPALETMLLGFLWSGRDSCQQK